MCIRLESLERGPRRVINRRLLSISFSVSFARASFLRPRQPPWRGVYTQMKNHNNNRVGIVEPHGHLRPSCHQSPDPEISPITRSTSTVPRLRRREWKEAKKSDANNDDQKKKKRKKRCALFLDASPIIWKTSILILLSEPSQKKGGKNRIQHEEKASGSPW